jgi:hypothetical protein
MFILNYSWPFLLVSERKAMAVWCYSYQHRPDTIKQVQTFKHLGVSLNKKGINPDMLATFVKEDK